MRSESLQQLVAECHDLSPADMLLFPEKFAEYVDALESTDELIEHPSGEGMNVAFMTGSGLMLTLPCSKNEDPEISP